MRALVRSGGFLLMLAGLVACSSGAPAVPQPTETVHADNDRGAEVTTIRGTATDPDEGGCLAEQSNAEAAAGHVDDGDPVVYAGVPPVSGRHWRTWPDIAKVFYVAEERPELARLVHSQEHGWTFVWYDESVADDEQAMGEVQQVADDIEGLSKIAVVPWTVADGSTFPDGTHVAVTHWTATANKEGTEWRQFCAAANAPAVSAFTKRHPSADAHEPYGP